MYRLYALIGYPLAHSFSPQFFNDKFSAEGIDAVYQAHPLSSISQFKDWLKAYPNLAGINVTIPYKETIVPYLDECDADATAIGAVNCITVKDGRTKGYNTDVVGFERSLQPILPFSPFQALVLGSGGGSKAVRMVLHKLGIPYNVVSRSGGGETITYGEVTPALLKEHLLIVNCTPLGMYPDVQSLPPLPYESLTREHVLYDLVYNPLTTEFMKKGENAKATTKNGLEMLHLQALAGWEIWNSPLHQPTV